MGRHSFGAQQALFTALTDASIADGRIYDNPRKGVSFPYVEIGESQGLPDDTSASEGGDDGVAETFTLHVWTRDSRGGKAAREIIGDIYSALHGGELTISGRSSALAWVRSDRVMLDPDGVTHHGVVDIEIIHRS